MGRTRERAAIMVIILMLVIGTPAASGATPSTTPAAAGADGWGRVPFSDGLRDRYGDGSIAALAAGPGGFVAVGSVATGAAVWHSPDGLRWSRVPGPDWSRSMLDDVTATPGGYVAVGSSRGGGAVWRSADGLHWQRTADQVGRGLQRVAVSSDGRLHAIETDENVRSWVWSSADGVAWSTDHAVHAILSAIAAGPAGLIVAGGDWTEDVGDQAFALASADGVTWTDVTPASPAGGWINDVVPFRGGWLAVGYQGEDQAAAAVWLSADGATWEAATSDSFSASDRDVYVNAVTVTPDGRALAAGLGRDGQATVWESDDGLAWRLDWAEAEDPDLEGTYEPYDVVATQARTVMVGDYPDLGYLGRGGPARSAAVWTDPAPPDAGQLERPITACPGRRPRLVDILALEPSRRPVCFGRRSLTFRAWLTELPLEGLDRATRPAWLTTCYAPGFASPERVHAGYQALVLDLHVAPSSDVPRQLPGKGWFIVTGHFDDPAARRCRRLVDLCRERFVVTAIRPTSVP